MIASPNCGERRHGLAPDMVVIHYTAMETAAAAIERLCDPEAEVSAHYVISKTGALTQLVAEQDRAWHAGAGLWGDVDDVNSHSIGIELDYQDGAFPEAQIAALEGLLRGILKRHDIAPERVIGHSDMAPARKFDPGPEFPWERMAGQGLAVWPRDVEPVPGDPSLSEMWDLFVKAAVRFGYHAPLNMDMGWEDEKGWHATLRAFRERFSLPHGDQICAHDVAVMSALARDYPFQSSDSPLTGRETPPN